MAAIFIGEHTHKVDSKGRVSIPADFRKVIDAADQPREPGSLASFILVYGNDSRDYLEAFPKDVHAELMKTIDAKPRGDKRRQFLQLFYSGYATPITVDETGRIVMPKKCRDKIGLGEEAFFIANGDTFHIWDLAAYEAKYGPSGDSGFDPTFDPTVYLDESF